MNTPIVVFTYNRLEHTKNLLESLEKCSDADEHDLFIFSDGPRNKTEEDKVGAVRVYLNEYKEKSRFKKSTLVLAEKNRGLAKSIISGVTEIINRYGTVIVLEDDLCVAENFISFMQDGLIYYQGDSAVGAISGFSSPLKYRKRKEQDVYKSRTGNSWGWATWKEVWERVDWSISDYENFREDKAKRKKFDIQQRGISNMLDGQMHGKIDSWAVRWDYFFFQNGLWTIYPYCSKVVNNGFDGSGIHCGKQLEFRNKKMELMPYQFRSLFDCKDLTKITSDNTFINRMKDFVRARIFL